jgi:hypothetical protein
LDNFSDLNKFDELTSQELLKIQQSLHAKNNSENLINANDSTVTRKFNQSDEISLINNELCEPLLKIANKFWADSN